ncbi:MAG: ABC transporter permease [Planctomycetota bacterium]
MIWRNFVSDISSLPKYKSLIRNLVGRDLKIKYRDSLMGYLWSLMNPVLMVITYIIAFKYIIGGRTASPQKIIVGISMWTFCAVTMSTSATAVLKSAQLLQKVAFPRIIPVISNQLFALTQHLVIYPILIVVLILFKVPVSFNWFYAIIILVLLNIMLFGIGLFLSAVTVYYRDVQHFLAIAINILFWFTPIIYKAEDMEKRSKILEYVINYTPFSPFIRSFTGAFCKGEALTGELTLHMLAYAAFSLLLGLLVFYRCQHRFVEKF